ncbi:ComF family protein [Ornithinimicrobium sp. W1665]|uniref:ComF family protein n=1 Tax=Ornithinimicrobium sp. W1665 TaxID=3416666 RepID=UPI003CF39188
MPWRPGQDLLDLLELAAPAACGGCGEAGTRWCPACADALADGGPRRWTPTPCPPGFPPTWTGTAYRDLARSAVVGWKDGGRADLTPALAVPLRAVLAAALDGSPEHLAALGGGGPVPVLPAPSARASTRARGEHRVEALARTALRGRRSVLPVVDGLRLGRRVADQAGLDAGQRRRNLAGAVVVRPTAVARVEGAPCIVVDDVVTTGATLVECARALVTAGAGPVVAVTLAATHRRPPRAPSSTVRGPLSEPSGRD